MREFRITMGNRPGELARVSTSLSRQGVSIKALCVTAGGNQVTCHLIGHDVEATRTALQDIRAQFSEQEVIELLLEDRAGALGGIAEQLAEAGINVDAIYLTGKVEDLIELALAVDDVKKAKRVLDL